MVLFKGRSSMKQFMPKKPVKRGYKIWVRANPVTAYMSQFDIYTGKPSNSEVFGDDCLGTRVVKKLCEAISSNDFERPVLVVFDKFFTSFELVKYLKEREICCVGTERINKKNLPEEMIKKPKLKRGEHKVFTKESVGAILWQDSRPVAVLSSAHDPNDVVTVIKTEKDGSEANVTCPKAIQQYTAYMRGVDKFDQLKEPYSVSRRSKKYWFRLFYFLFDVALVNAYVLYCMVKADDVLL